MKWIMRVQTHAGLIITSTPMALPTRPASLLGEHTAWLAVPTCAPIKGDPDPPQVVLVPTRDIALVELRHANMTDVSAGETMEPVPGVHLHPQAKEQR